METDRELEEARNFLRQQFNRVIRKNAEYEKENLRKFIKLSISTLEKKIKEKQEKNEKNEHDGKTLSTDREEKELVLFQNVLLIFDEEYIKYKKDLNEKEKGNDTEIRKKEPVDELELTKKVIQSSYTLSEWTAKMNDRISKDTRYLREKQERTSEKPKKEIKAFMIRKGTIISKQDNER